MTQTADLGTQAAFTVQLTNPYSTDVTYNLATVGLDGYTVDLASSVTVPAGQTVTTPLDVSVPLTAAAITTGFEVRRDDLRRRVGLGRRRADRLAPQVVLQNHAVSLGRSPPRPPPARAARPST